MEKDLLQRLEARFDQLPPEKREEKRQEYARRFSELVEGGMTEEEAVAALEKRLTIPDVPEAAPKEDYGRISHPKKPLLTGTLYAIALVIFVAGAILFQRLFG